MGDTIDDLIRELTPDPDEHLMQSSKPPATTAMLLRLAEIVKAHGERIAALEAQAAEIQKTLRKIEMYSRAAALPDGDIGKLHTHCGFLVNGHGMVVGK